MRMLIDSHADRHITASRSPEARAFRLPPGILKPANRLLDQQFWLWGCDIRRQEGNILSELGFEKIKAPTETGLNTSQYRCPLSTTCWIALWGFGVCLTDFELGSVFVPRAGLFPRTCQGLIDTAPAWEPAWFDRLSPPATNRDVVPCYQLVHQLVAWIAWYEQRVIDIAGLAYRQQMIGAWKRPVANAAPLTQQWRDLGVVLQRHSLVFYPAAGPAHS